MSEAEFLIDAQMGLLDDDMQEFMADLHGHWADIPRPAKKKRRNKKKKSKGKYNGNTTTRNPNANNSTN